MYKIFTVEVTLVQQKHMALVSVHGTGNTFSYHIQLIDEFLKNRLSMEHIRYKGDSGYKELEAYHDPNKRQIIERIASAIKGELFRNYAVIKRLFPMFR